VDLSTIANLVNAIAVTAGVIFTGPILISWRKLLPYTLDLRQRYQRAKRGQNGFNGWRSE